MINNVIELAKYNGCKTYTDGQRAVAYFSGTESAEVWGATDETQARELIKTAFQGWYVEEPSFGGYAVDAASKLRPYVFEATPEIPSPNFVFSVWPYRPSKFPKGLRTTQRI